MDEDKKENFRMEIVKKGLGFHSESICRVEVYLPLIFHTCAVKTLKLCISLVLLIGSLCSPGGHCFGRNSLPISYQYTQLKLSTSLQQLGF